MWVKVQPQGATAFIGSFRLRYARLGLARVRRLSRNRPYGTTQKEAPRRALDATGARPCWGQKSAGSASRLTLEESFMPGTPPSRRGLFVSECMELQGGKGNFIAPLRLP